MLFKSEILPKWARGPSFQNGRMVSDVSALRFTLGGQTLVGKRGAMCARRGRRRSGQGVRLWGRRGAVAQQVKSGHALPHTCAEGLPSAVSGRHGLSVILKRGAPGSAKSPPGLGRQDQPMDRLFWSIYCARAPEVDRKECKRET